MYMKNLNEKVIKTLFSRLCCSNCKNDFTKESLIIKERKSEIYICNLKCEKCGKDFGDVIFKLNSSTKFQSPLEIIEGPPPITANDVLDAHEFIKKNL